MGIAAFIVSAVSFAASLVALILNFRKKHQVATLNFYKKYEEIYDYCFRLSENSSEGIAARNRITAHPESIDKLLLLECLYGKKISNEFYATTDYTSSEYKKLLVKMQNKYVKEMKSANSTF